MKRLSVKTHEKFLLAAVILSCGLVMHADPPAGQKTAKRGPVIERKLDSNHSVATRIHTAKATKIRVRQHHLDW